MNVDDCWTYPVIGITKVVDGDTVRVVIDLGFGVLKKVEVRVSGIDTPETRGPQREAGRTVKRWTTRLLSKWFNEQGLILRSRRLDKYGRSLGDLLNTETDESYVQRVLHEGLAKAYSGGTKQTFTEQEVRHVTKRAALLLEAFKPEWDPDEESA